MRAMESRVNEEGIVMVIRLRNTCVPQLKSKKNYDNTVVPRVWCDFDCRNFMVLN